jgi:hypothetical protein
LFNRRLFTRWVNRNGGRIVTHVPENARFLNEMAPSTAGFGIILLVDLLIAHPKIK